MDAKDEGYKNQDYIMDLLLKEDEITWQTLLHELVRTEQMDPWDIDISILSQRYIEMIKKLQAFDFRISGKVLLAAAIMLHMKSTRFIESDIANLNNLINPPPESSEEEGFYEEVPLDMLPPDKITLIPRTPQPRKRKVSVYDLIDALQKALEVRKRRILREVVVPDVVVPERKVDITKLIYALYNKIKIIFESKEKLTFADLLGSDKREEKVYTIVPLLHLTTQRKIDLEQETPFGEIEIKLIKNEVKKDVKQE